MSFQSGVGDQSVDYMYRMTDRYTTGMFNRDFGDQFHSSLNTNAQLLTQILKDQNSQVEAHQQDVLSVFQGGNWTRVAAATDPMDPDENTRPVDPPDERGGRRQADLVARGGTLDDSRRLRPRLDESASSSSSLAQNYGVSSHAWVYRRRSSSACRGRSVVGKSEPPPSYWSVYWIAGSPRYRPPREYR